MKYFTLILALLMTFGIAACAKNPAPVQVSPSTFEPTNVHIHRKPGYKHENGTVHPIICPYRG